MNGRERLAAIVLCGGRSQRMGRDKATVEAGAETLLGRVVRLAASACDPIVVVASPEQALPRLAPGSDSSVRIARDAVAFEGPLAGLAAGLAALGEGDPARAFVVGVDAVRVTPELIRAFAAFGGVDDAVAVTDDDGRPWPLPVLLPAARARSVAAACLAAGERSLRSLVEGLAPTRASRAELLARSPPLRGVDPSLRGLEDADDEEALERLLAEGH